MAAFTPLTALPGGAAPLAPGAAAEVARNMVLLLEDHETIASLIKVVLAKRLGLTVLTVATVEAGQREFVRHQSKIAVVVADCRLLDGDSRALCRSMRDGEPGLPLLLTSGCESVEDFAPLSSERLVQFLPKPYTPSEMATQVRALLLEAQRGGWPVSTAGFV